MSKPPKIDRKALKVPDQFVKQGRHILEIFVGYHTPILSFVVVLVVVACAYYGYQWKQASDLEKSWTRYAQVIKAPEPGRWEDLKKMHAEFASNRATQFAAASLADHYFSEAVKQSFKDPKATPADAAIAVDWYTKALNFSGLTPPERGLLLINRGGAYEMGAKLDESMKDFESAAATGAQVKPMALLGQGRLYELKNNQAKAIETYEKVSADFLNSEYSKMAKTYLRRLKSPLLKETNS